MKQDEKWLKNYREVEEYMETHHRNPSKHRVEDRLMLNWLKHQRKLMNRGDLRADRIEMFKKLLARAERYKRANQWAEIDVSILNEDDLREYQQGVLKQIHEAWKTCRSVMVQMPTGTGKTHLMAAVIREAKQTPPQTPPLKGAGSSSGGGVLVVAHRRELIEQISMTLEAFEVELGLILAGKNADLTKKVQVASIQTLTRRLDPTPGPSPQRGGELLRNINPSLIVVDEAHHALADTYREMWERWPEAKFLGLTATPCRLSGEPFTDLFDTLVQSWSLVEFIRRGWLSDLDYVSVKPNSVAMQRVASLNKRGADGDFQQKQMANVLDVPESIEHIYQSYRTYADGKKGIVYAINRQHAQHIAEYYQTHGVKCCMIDATTPTEKRRQWVEDYREGNIDVLVNVDIFSSGFDCPEVEFIQLARPTLSLSLYLQQVGRGMRISKGKSQVTILDQVGSWLVFGLPTSNWDWQAMFEGRLAGKGNVGNLTVNPNASSMLGEEKELVNEEMVRIQSLLSKIGGRETEVEEEEVETYGEAELSIFKELGLYGIKSHGEVCIPAQFEGIYGFNCSEKYFAKAKIPVSKTGTSKERWTVISMTGEDLKADLRGYVEGEENDIFICYYNEWGRRVSYCWDAISRQGYEHTSVARIGGLEFFYAEMERTYTLRGMPEYRRKIDRNEVLYNDHVVIIDHDLLVKGETVSRYKIVGYLKDSILIKEGRGVRKITAEGCTGERIERMPVDTVPFPNLRRLKLKRQAGRYSNSDGQEVVKLRSYQQEMLDNARLALYRRKTVLLQMPLGVGRSEMLINILRQEMAYYTGGTSYVLHTVLIVSHRDELKAHYQARLRKLFPRVRMLNGRFNTDIYHNDITLCSTQDILNHPTYFPNDYLPTLVIMDEAHLIPKAAYEQVQKRWKPEILGVTATPERTKALNLNEVYRVLIPSWSIKEFINKAWLKDINYVSVGSKNKVDEEQIYNAYEQYAKCKQGIVCAANSSQAQRIAECYRNHGVAVKVCEDMGVEALERVLTDFWGGELTVLVDVHTLSEGYRCPEVDFVQLAYLADSLSTYLHQVECGMRIMPELTDEQRKYVRDHEKLTVLDHVGAKKKFGLPTEEHDWWELFSGKKRPERPVRTKKKVECIEEEEPKEDAAPPKPVVDKKPVLTKSQLRMMRLRGEIDEGKSGE